MGLQHRYWVIGGEYSCLSFREIKEGRPEVFGPYATQDEAETPPNRRERPQTPVEYQSRLPMRSFGTACPRLEFARFEMTCQTLPECPMRGAQTFRPTST